MSGQKVTGLHMYHDIVCGSNIIKVRKTKTKCKMELLHRFCDNISHNFLISTLITYCNFWGIMIELMSDDAKSPQKRILFIEMDHNMKKKMATTNHNKTNYCWRMYFLHNFYVASSGFKLKECSGLFGICPKS